MPDAFVDGVLPLIERLFRAFDDFRNACLCALSRLLRLGRRGVCRSLRGFCGGRVAFTRTRNESSDRSFAQLVEQPFAALLDQIAQGSKRHTTRLALEILGNDQRERDLGLVLFGRVVDDLNLFAGPDHLADLLQRDVATIFRVVQFTVGVPLDDATWRCSVSRGLLSSIHDVPFADQSNWTISTKVTQGGVGANRASSTGNNCMNAFELRGVSVTYGGRQQALENIDLQVRKGEICAVLGPNGAGKSTLVKVVSGALAPDQGSVVVLGEQLSQDRRDIARKIAVVPQASEPALGFTVRSVVMMGRAPYQGAWMRASERDEQAVARALAACELEALADRLVTALSGGEQQRVTIARALAQEAPILLLDEANAHLDVRHSIAVNELVRREVRDRELACVMVLHDLNSAAQYADRIALLKAGRLVAHGTIEEVMTYRRLKEVFETELYVGVNELDNARYFLPVRPQVGPFPRGDR